MTDPVLFASKRRYVLGATLLGGACAIGTAASAATITVNTTSGAVVADGMCSLPEALGNANTDTSGNVDCAPGSGADTIVFSGVSGTITLSGQLHVSRSTTIQGPGSAALTVAMDASVASRVFYIGNSGGAIDVSISGVTVTGGHTLIGAGLFIGRGANLTLSNAVVTGNTASGGSGGGLRADHAGAITITGSTLSNNSSAIKGGGAFFYQTGAVTIDQTTISGNSSGSRGGGIALYQLTNGVSITRSVVSGNTSTNRGGGLFLYKVTSAQIQDTTISGNTSNNRGGGIFLYKSAGATMLDRVTISGNQAPTSSGNGGGAYLYKISGGGTVTFQNSTIANNSATIDGGGIQFGNMFGGGTVALLETTITGNTAGASGGNINRAAFGSPTTVNIRNSIIAGGSAPTAPDFNSGDLTVAMDYSLLQNTSGASFTGGSNVTGVDPMLGPLADNGGLTQTRAPVAFSPILNTGDPAFTPPPATDQRGQARVQMGRIDMGAVESPPFIVPTLGQWAMLLLSSLLGMAGFLGLRRRAS